MKFLSRKSSKLASYAYYIVTLFLVCWHLKKAGANVLEYVFSFFACIVVWLVSTGIVEPLLGNLRFGEDKLCEMTLRLQSQIQDHFLDLEKASIFLMNKVGDDYIYEVCGLRQSTVIFKISDGFLMLSGRKKAVMHVKRVICRLHIAT